MKKTTRKYVILILVVIALASVLALCSCDNSYTPNLFVAFDYKHVVYYGDGLDALRPYLTVTYYSERGELTQVNDYTLSGSLLIGNNTISVKYKDLTADIVISVFEKSQEQPDVEYTVTFVASSVTVGTQKYTEKDKNISEPQVPQKTGYNGVWEDYVLTTGNITVNAVYTAKQYAVTLDYDGATEGNTQQTITTTYYEPLGALPNPSKSGHVFTGWYLGDSPVKSTTWWTTDNDEAVLTAHWRNLSVATEGLKFTINRDGESYTLSGIGDATDTDIVIPSTYEGKPVTAIGTDAFHYCKKITSVVIPEGVTSIGAHAFFGCESLLSVVIPDSVTTLVLQAFAFCSNLTNVAIPDSVTYIGGSSFEGCSSLTSITIPDSVTYIGEESFARCASLTSIVVGNANPVYHSAGNCLIETASKTLLRGCRNSVIPTDGSVTSIARNAFNYCSGLESITVPNSVTSIGSGAFEYCTDLVSVILPDSITLIDSFMFEGCRSLASITIPNNVTSIGWRAFYNCSSLTDVAIPNSIQSVSSSVFYNCNNLNYNRFGDVDYLGNSENPYLVAIKAKDTEITRCEIYDGAKIITGDAFDKCSNLTSITIPDSVIYIDGAFYACSSLESIVVGKANTVYHSDGNCLIETASKTLLIGCQNSVIPADGSVTKIGGGAFSGSGITSIVIPDCITSIGAQAFLECAGLTSVTIGNGVKSIQNMAFCGCIGLTNVTIPDSVTSIGEAAFADCTGLVSVTIGKGVASMGDWVFTRCSDLVRIVVDEENTVYHSDGNCLIETASKTLLRGGKDSVIPTDGSVTSIDNSAFAGCSNMTSIIIPDSVTLIGAWAFHNCLNLTSITIPESVTYMVGSTFYGCGNLAEIRFDGTVEQWNDVYKGAGWNILISATKVICSDGEVEII